ncbi:MAG: hypothetical protein HQL31_01145 [Planctomycetes bacterium]|nr:hypothetical protein [Planctomycetota bacterium]
MLGPLCVAVATLEDDAASLLDSKKVHKSGNLSPLIRTCLGLAGREALLGFFDALREPFLDSQHNEPWFVELLPQVIGELSRQVESEELRNSPAPLRELKLAILGTPPFNALIEEGYNKAEVLLNLIRGLVDKTMERAAGEKVQIRCDRLGGRRYYSDVIGTWGGHVLELREGPVESWYSCRWKNKLLEVDFTVKGDEKYPSIAAASLFAKLSREVLMLCMNRWWQLRVPGVRATAGYAQDAPRFMKDIESYLTTHNIAPENLVRRR